MSSDKFYANIIAKAIENNYENNELSFTNQGWTVSTISSTLHFITLKVQYFSKITYILINVGNKEPSVNLKEFFENLNDNKSVNVNEKKGRVLKEIWTGYNIYKEEYKIFYNEYNSFDILFAGHGISASISGVAAGIYNVNSVLFAPIPFMVEKKWLQNYSFDKKPTTYVNKNDPYIGNYRQWFQIYWESSKHYFVEYISNGHWLKSHSIYSYVNYFRKKTFDLC
tara:strand:- start:6 stop:680 length:675 start_codon:yes stop_codon:yes gene_type:complete